MTAKAALELDRVSLKLGERDILRDVSFSVGEGETLVVAGPSGSGKTTLLRVVLGLVAPTSGVVRLGGEVVSAEGRIVRAPHERRIGAVFQDLALFPHLSVEGNLAFALTAGGTASDERQRRITDALRDVGLPGFERRNVRELSGGEQQRVALARALVTDPKLIVLDEALASLDVLTRDAILALLETVLAAAARTAIAVTHDPEDASRLGDRIAFLDGGAISKIGTPIELVRSVGPSPFVRAFLARMGSSTNRSA